MNSVLGNDVLYLKSMIGKKVAVQTVDNRNHEGIVYVIDPVSKTVVLTNPDSNSLEFVLNHAIRSFSVLSEHTSQEFVQNIEKSVCVEEIEQRRVQLVKWLKHMFLDVKEAQDLIKVEDHLMIGPPYGIQNCMCDNTIVLERITKIIELMPLDFK